VQSPSGLIKSEWKRKRKRFKIECTFIKVETVSQERISINVPNHYQIMYKLGRKKSDYKKPKNERKSKQRLLRPEIHSL
jgi:hypothetical protein